MLASRTVKETSNGSGLCGSSMKYYVATAFVLFTVCHGLAIPPTLHRRAGSKLAGVQAGSKTSLSVVSAKDLLPGVAAIDEANSMLVDRLKIIRQSPHFRYHSVDILASCEYMPQELYECYSATCEIYPVDDEQVPAIIRETDFAEHEFDLDGWGRWDMPTNEYYDTEEYPEAYTGYDGSMVWKYIHDRICFQSYESGRESWKGAFNKAVSGMHSAVSAQVVRGIQEKLNSGEEFSDEEVWRDPREEFNRRLTASGETPLAMENLYFAYMILLSAAGKANARFQADCDSGKFDGSTASSVRAFLESPILDDPAIRGAASSFEGFATEPHSSQWEARMRTRELLRVINCVQCTKCRLHGKIVMMGFSTALQIHLSGGLEPISRIQRVGLVALISTLYKFATAVEFCKNM